jgi:hypothetical protein
VLKGNRKSDCRKAVVLRPMAVTALRSAVAIFTTARALSQRFKFYPISVTALTQTRPPASNLDKDVELTLMAGVAVKGWLAGGKIMERL